MSYVWRQLFVRKVRSLLCILGVAVSVAMIVSILSISQGMRSSLNKYMVASGASLVVFDQTAADLAFSRVPPEDVARLRDIDGVHEIARANFAMIFSPKLGEAKQTGVFSAVFCFGRFFDEPIAKKYGDRLTKGSMPTSPSQILIGRLVAERIGLDVGDQFPLFHRTYLDIEQYEVTGIFESELSWENLGMVVDARVIQEKLGGGEQVSLVFLYTDPDAVDGIRAQIEKELPSLIAMRSSEFTERFSDQLEYIDQFLIVLQLIAGIVGVLGVLNTMMMSVSERVREIGTLRALGWSRSRVVRVIVAEGLLIAVLGGFLGLAFGILGTEAVIAWVSDGVLVADYAFENLLQGFALALGVGFFGSLYPARRAASLRPAEALRYE